jgi:tRNA threonylcarbamoyladenosine biosynthesis protein TsaB
MNVLAFDTSTETMSIAVQRSGGPSAQVSGQVFEHTGPGGAQASLHLIPVILRLLDEARLTPAALDVIAFGRGPGSFTGLRTACSVAQGLAFGARGGVGAPVLPVDTLLAVAEEARWQRALAAPAAPSSLLVLAVLDARMGEIYANRYHYSCCENNSFSWAFDKGCTLIRPEIRGLDPFLDGPGTGSAMLAGNVFDLYGPALDAAVALHGGSATWSRLTAMPTATAMLRLVPQLLQAGHAVAADQALPIYIRDKVAQTTEERRLAKTSS